MMPTGVNIASAFIVLLGIQCLHSAEELSTGFHRKWYLLRMPFSIFLTFEIMFLGMWFAVLFLFSLPYRETLMQIFNVLMLANGIQHLVWAALVRQYVPGLVTAPFFIIAFVWFSL